jgi:hypothetical protein
VRDLPCSSDGVPKAVAGDGAPKLLTKGVPVALLPNMPMSGVVAGSVVGAIEGTGVVGPPELLEVKGPGFLGTGPEAKGYLVLNDGIPRVPAEHKNI